MLRDQDRPERQIEKLKRINAALIERIDRADNARSSTYALFQTTAVLEKEIVARNRDLEKALAQLGSINRELAQAREQADEANRAKSRFLRAASHDLLQPLSAAKLFLTHLEELTSDPLQLDLVALIGNAFEITEELIRALLEISRLESRRLDVSFEPVSLGRLFHRLAGDFSGQATARGLMLRFVPSSQMVISDPVYLRRIAQNLISNAIKYTERGSVLVGARRCGAYIWLEVHDTGVGIRPEDQERIFNEFERLSPDGEVQGTGLGLSIVRRACARLDHQIELRSTKGQGSVFRVRMPRVSVMDRQAGQIPVFAGQTAGAPDSLAGRTVIVVEDDAPMRSAYVRLFDRWGMHVLSAEGTSTALSLLRSTGQRPDVIVTDYQLRQGDCGTETIRALRGALETEVPAMLVTAERAPSLVAEAARLAAAVLEKPVAQADLHATLQRLLSNPPKGEA